MFSLIGMHASKLARRERTRKRRLAREAALLLAACASGVAGCSGPKPPAVVPYEETDPSSGYGDMTSYLEAYVRTYRLPAMGAAIVDADGIVALGVAGTRRAGSEVPVTLEDKWHIGSSAKSMTATLLAVLVDEGSLSWHTTLAEVFPELKATMHAHWREVTLEQLLTHRGGGPSNIIDNYPELWERLVSRQGTSTEQRLSVVRTITSDPPESQPGTRYIYANAGYVIAGAMAERVADSTWEELMRTRLFEPLGITSAGFGAPGTRTTLDQPRGHDDDGNPVEPGPGADNPPGIGPAGTVHLSIEDWAGYAQFHLSGTARKPELLAPETLEILHKPYPGEGPRYAMGWDVTDEAGPDVHVLAHTGSNTRWYSMIWMPLELGFGVLVVTNQGGDLARDAVDQAVWNLAVDHMQRARGKASEAGGQGEASSPDV